MDLLKTAFFAMMLLAVGLMWINRDFVVDAYAQSEAPTELRFSGVDLDFEKTELPASPYVVHIGEDTRRRPLSLLFTDPEIDEPIAMTEGKARIEGTVLHEGKPAVGGTVRLERHTSDGIGTLDVPVNAKGWYSARDLPGGRYRVRAWLPGAATMTESQVFFVEAESVITRSFELEPVDSDPMIEFLNGGVMYVGLNGGFGVMISQNRVDNEGIIVSRGIEGAYVTAVFSAEVELLSNPIQVTNSEGLAQFRLRCLRPGAGVATVTFGDQVHQVALPGCRAVPATTQTTAPAGNGSQPGAGGNTSTTAGTTTKPTAKPNPKPTPSPTTGGSNG